MRTLPAHTAVAPSLDCLTVASQLLARKVVEQLGIPAGDDLVNEVSHPVSTALFDSIRTATIDFTPISLAEIQSARKLVNGLVVEEFQKKKNTSVLPNVHAVRSY